MRPEFDRFGSTLRNIEKDVEYLDLTQFDVKFIFQSRPAGLHFHSQRGEILSSPFLPRVTMVRPNGGVEQLLSQPGVHHLMYVQRRSGHVPLFVRSHVFRAGTPQAEFSTVQPKTMSEWLVSWGDAVDLTRFPHCCPRCSKPAYIGFSVVECSAGCV